MFELHLDRPYLPKSGLLILPQTTGSLRELSESCFAPIVDLDLRRYIARSDYTGKFGEFISIAVPLEVGPTHVLLLGFENWQAASRRELMILGGHIANEASRIGVSELYLCDIDSLSISPADSLPEPEPENSSDLDRAICGVMLGVGLAFYGFERYRTKSPSNVRPQGISYLVSGDDRENVNESIKRGRAELDAVYLARDLSNSPPNEMTPTHLCEAAEQLCELGVKVRILDEQELVKQRFPGVLAVGSGSAEPSKVAILEWRGCHGEAPIELGLAGKGVTFDSGGLTLKTEAQQRTMKCDMGGAASVIGSIYGIATQGLNIGVVGIIGAVENLPGPNAFRSGDVLSMRNGTSVEISFPDAEGRIVLADLLDYLHENYELNSVIDIATLTYTVSAALGQQYIGLYSNSESLSESLLEASQKAGEQMWRLPVDPSYLSQLESTTADLKNMPDAAGGIAPGSASVAAAFIQHFAANTHWAHLDTGGSEWSNQPSELGPAGALGSAVSTIIEWVSHLAAGDQ